jgi:AsmA protein
MDLMLTAFGVELPAAPALGDKTGPVISTVPLPWALLRGPTVNLSAKVEAMTFQGQVWNNVDFAIGLSGGHLLVSPLTLSLPDGQLRMSMAVDASRDAVPVSLEMHAPGIPLALVARYAGLPGPMGGAVRIDAQFQGDGQTPHELAASLDGTVSAVLVGGSMTNAAFIMLTSASLEALGINVPAQGETALHCFGLVGSFTKGVGLLRTIALDTTYLQVDGNGQVDFAQETVAFKLRPLAQVSGSAIAVPVILEGPFRAMKGRLDADGIDKLGLFIDSLFGSDHSTGCIDAGFMPYATPGGKPG